MRDSVVPIPNSVPWNIDIFFIHRHSTENTLHRVPKLFHRRIPSNLHLYAFTLQKNGLIKQTYGP